MNSRSLAAADPRRRIALVAAVFLGSFIATLDVSIVNVALPTLQRALSTDLAGLQWVIDIYALCLSAFMLSAGPLGDRYGRKRAWLAGVSVFTIGSALCAMATSLPTLLAGRAVQGVAGALLIPGALSLLAPAYPQPASRARVIGGWSSFTALSLILGPMLGGLLMDHAGWQSIFLINISIGLLTVGLGLWGIQDSAHPEHAALDPLGQVLSVLWLGALTYGLIVAGEHGWGSAQASSALVSAAVGLALFLAVEARVARPLLPLGLFLGAGSGLAVPATGTAVMASVPAQRSGMASATMNALRQAGMLIGIALLGTLMSTRATSLLADALEQAGLGNARQAAVAAVGRHDLGALTSLDVATAHQLLADALAGGFHAAMACAGIAGLLAAGLLASVRPRAAAVPARA
jgi:MFS family permease